MEQMEYCAARIEWPDRLLKSGVEAAPAKRDAAVGSLGKADETAQQPGQPLATFARLPAKHRSRARSPLSSSGLPSRAGDSL
ncbi:MAG: hypothetical protein PS018_20480 [bacterium]|nr:hypothetical protein [bacterium]